MPTIACPRHELIGWLFGLRASRNSELLPTRRDVAERILGRTSLFPPRKLASSISALHGCRYSLSLLSLRTSVAH